MGVVVLISTLGRVGSRVTLAFVGISLTLAATGCGSAAVGAPPLAPDGPLVQQLTSEVSDARAFKHLQALQKIADQHGGNRAAGTRGYDASVDYVVDALRDIGFKASTPSYRASGRDGGRSPQRNVIAQTRTGDPNHVVMIGAHLDSVEDGPGIVDDGSGGGNPAGDRHRARGQAVGAEHGAVRVLRR
jgi:aminopeptidase S